MIEPKNTVAAALPLPAVADLEMLQHKSFSHFLHKTNPDNGLVIDKTAEDWPASIAATGLALESYPVAVERKFMPRSAAVERTLTTLRFFWNSLQGPEPDATPDPDDRHVLAAAIRAGADVIVTFNLADFPSDVLSPFNIEARHPDDFVLALIDLDEETVCAAVERQRAGLKNPPKSVDDHLETLRA
jgi:hypothetical protein